MTWTYGRRPRGTDPEDTGAGPGRWAALGTSHALPLAVALALALAACSRSDPSWSPQFESCRHIQVIDAENGAPIRGIEDIALDPMNALLWLSAYNRWRVEARVDTNAAHLSAGGLYPLDLDRLRTAPERVTVHNAAAPWSGAATLFPHGVGLAAPDRPGGPARLAVINRHYRRPGPETAWQTRPTIELFRRQGPALTHEATLSEARLCNANDVAAVSESRLYVSSDRGSCGFWGRMAENVFGLARGAVLTLTLRAGAPEAPAQLTSLERFADGIAFANGIVLSVPTPQRARPVDQVPVDQDKIVDPGTGSAAPAAQAAPTGPVLFVAATRADAILAFDPLTTAPVAPPIVVPGGADNLSLTASGSLIAAVHPSLLTLALYRHRWFGTEAAPSRIIRVAPRTGTVEVLFDDPDGQLFSAATSAIMAEGTLVAGSVADSGILVCE